MTIKYEIWTPDDVTKLCILPKLAAEIGLNESLVLRQIIFWIKNSNNLRDGEYWTFQSLRGMKKKAFDFWGVNTINRAVKKLEAHGLIKVTDEYNARKGDKTRWFTLIPEGIAKLSSVEIRAITDEVKAVPKRNSKKQEKPNSSNSEGDKAVPERNSLFQNGTTLPETTQRITDKKIKDSAPADTAQPPAAIDKSKPARPRDRLFDAVAWAWNTNGSFTGKLKNFVTGQTDADKGKWHQYQIDPARPMMPDEVVGFRIWCEKNDYLHPKAGVPTKKPDELNDRIEDFRGAPNYTMLVEAGQRYLAP